MVLNGCGLPTPEGPKDVFHDVCNTIFIIIAIIEILILLVIV